MDEPFFHVILAGLLGLSLGSFANVFAARYPAGESIVGEPSRCPACRRPVRPWDNVPVLSWLVLGGRCRDCRGPISVQYPLVELAFGLGSAWLIAAFGFSPLTAYFWLVDGLLVLAALIDLRTFYLYDVLTYPLIAAGLSGSLLFPWLYGGWGASLAGAAVLALVMACLAWSGRRLFGREALGDGDVKLMVAAGGFLGWQQGLWALCLACAAAAVYALWALARGARLKDAIPFGPFLAAACVAGGLDLMSGSRFLRWITG